MGILIAVISSGLVCYLLARSMTRPVTRLRQAAQSLAAGDLTARTGAPAGGPRGEMVELMRDFDRMAERLETLVESQSRLLKDVSHELRSPLARLSVALGLARQRSAPEIEGQLNRIELEADRLNQLIQRLLTISRLESGADGIHKAHCRCGNWLRQVVRDAEYESAGRQCQMVAAGDDEFLVEADADLLHSAIENVVRNATRYTAEGTNVNVRLQRENGANGEEIVIRVSGFGPGCSRRSLVENFRTFLPDRRRAQPADGRRGIGVVDRRPGDQAARRPVARIQPERRRVGGGNSDSCGFLVSHAERQKRPFGDSGFALPAHS